MKATKTTLEAPLAREPGRPLRPEKVQRFRKSERMLHWAIAVPFLTSAASAIVLVLFYNPNPLRPYRAVFAWTHRASGACLLILPILAVLWNRFDFRAYLRNAREAWTWRADDLKWLLLQGPAALGRRVTLPEVGKFNAAQKLNLLMVMGTWPLFAVTGAAIWFMDVAFVSWLLHFLVAAAALPLVAGHIYMAVINRGTRKGLSGMFTGLVDRVWAQHHYPRWFRETFGDLPAAGIAARPTRAATVTVGLPPVALPAPQPSAGTDVDPLQRRARIRCDTCQAEPVIGCWGELLDRIFAAGPLLCPECNAEIVTITPMISDLDLLDPILRHLEQGGDPRLATPEAWAVEAEEKGHDAGKKETLLHPRGATPLASGPARHARRLGIDVA